MEIKRNYLPFGIKSSCYAAMLVSLMTLIHVQEATASGLDDLLDQPSSESTTERPNSGSLLIKNLKASLGDTTAEQTIFFDFFKKAQFEKALFQWKSAFGGTHFSNSLNGKALHGFLLFKIGIQQGGAELLLSQQNIGELDPELAKMWSVVLGQSPEVFKRTALPYNPNWATLFGPLSEAYAKSSYIKNVASPEDSNRLRRLATNGGMSNRFSWMHIQDLIQKDKIKDAAGELKIFSKENQGVIGNDLISLTIARVLFQFGYLDKALEYYLKVPKSSPYSIEAAEEQAWTFIRKGEPQKSVELLKGFILDNSNQAVGPEPFFVHAIAQLKLCNPKQVANDLKIFQKKFNSRLSLLGSIVKSNSDKQILSLLEEASQAGSAPAMLDKISPKYSELLEGMPRLILRDLKFIDLADAVHTTSEESKAAAKLYERSITGSTDSVGFQAHFDIYRKQAADLHQSYLSLGINYIQELAKQEIAEIKSVAAKLQILEAELINRSSVVHSTVASTAKQVGLSSAKASGTELSKASGFTNPTILDTEQIWFDNFDDKVFPPSGSCAKSL